ncbi:tigger transposable element-derived protein 6-like [Mercenaria mercenaria]|uniref:tigger transposable element-derived protein 6-like n=1 Tax=Mercenaria mercenaria TaxID=6596 RepID=UPI00234F5DB3|nr:tigger transposable element-derived protein 6-like [Mercenaria mercenaria]
MEDWLKELDRTMRAQNRKILLLLDNAPVHPKVTLENVKLQFFPANTTSALQPMDAGITHTVKLKYRQRQLQHVLLEMEKQPTKLGPKILRDITILQAIYWINAVWQEVRADTIQKCFANCGFTEASVSDVSVVNDSECDTVFDIEDDYPLAVLKLSSELFGCEFKELLDIDNQFSTCDNNLQDWDRPTEILRDLSDCRADECESDNEQEDVPAESSVSSTDVAQYLEKIRQYALCKNQPAMLDKVMDLDDLFTRLKVEMTDKQTKISDFFKEVKCELSIKTDISCVHCSVLKGKIV